MKFLIIGLGSMGKRRVRNLLALGHTDITGFDVRDDRRQEGRELYGITAIEEVGDMSAYDAVFICVPPDLHMRYMKEALESRVHAFVEHSSVFEEGVRDLAAEVRRLGLKFYASGTLRFHPSVRKIKQLVDSGAIGKLLNFSYHAGGYLPEWHPWEGLDFYGSKRETSANREMVLFDFLWIGWVLGELADAKAFYGKTSSMDADIDDVYAIALKFKNGVLGTYMVDQVSRNNCIRTMILNGEKGQIFWNWEERKVKLYNGDERTWVHYHEPAGKAADGYNPMVIEEMYIDEVRAFLESIENDTQVAITLEEDLANIGYLRMIEPSGIGKEN